MICALMIGRAGSRGFPNKNIANVLGRKLCEYPLLAAKNSLVIIIKVNLNFDFALILFPNAPFIQAGIRPPTDCTQSPITNHQKF